MARKPAPRAEFVMFDVFYEDGSRRSNRKVPHLAASTLMLPLSLSWNNKTDLLPRSPVIPPADRKDPQIR
jgi:hypothetical protein